MEFQSEILSIHRSNDLQNIWEVSAKINFPFSIHWIFKWTLLLWSINDKRIFFVKSISRESKIHYGWNFQDILNPSFSNLTKANSLKNWGDLENVIFQMIKILNKRCAQLSMLLEIICQSHWIRDMCWKSNWHVAYRKIRNVLK
jgi:hypothetical protein